MIEGEWHPQGAEWLEGTEIRRLVALPWSEQLELVIRSLELGDPIRLIMSNQDEMEYQVLLVQEVPADLVGLIYSNSPSLVIIMAEKDSDTRWAVVAVP